MTLSYDDIYSSFLGYITDYDIASMNTQMAYDQMQEWLHKSCSNPYVRRLFAELDLNDDSAEINYELNLPDSTLSDEDFIVEVLSKGMVVAWLHPQVKSRLLTDQFFGGKEQKWFAQANHLSQVRALYDDARIEQRKIIRDRGYIINSYLEDQNAI